MEIAAMILIYGLFGLAIGYTANKLSKMSTEVSDKNKLTRIDDKNWIVDGKLVSLEEDTPLLRFEQEQEDSRMYWEYESNKLMHDRKEIGDTWMKTIKAIHDMPDLKESVTEETLSIWMESFLEYDFKCDKLKEIMKLELEDFVIMRENPAFCCALSWCNPMSTASIYHISNEKTAKYANGDVNELIAAEFKAKWY